MAWWTKPGKHWGKSWWRKQEGKRALREDDSRTLAEQCEDAEEVDDDGWNLVSSTAASVGGF